jgi:hypothetical protein
MKHFSLILALIFSIFCKGQDYKQFYSKEFEWRLNIPDDFESVSKQKDKQFASEGKKALEKTVGAEIEDNSKQIFLYTKNRTNYIMSNWQEFDEKKDFNVYVVFIDKIIGEELLKNLRSSTFGI